MMLCHSERSGAESRNLLLFLVIKLDLADKLFQKYLEMSRLRST